MPAIVWGPDTCEMSWRHELFLNRLKDEPSIACHCRDPGSASRLRRSGERCRATPSTPNHLVSAADQELPPKRRHGCAGWLSRCRLTPSGASRKVTYRPGAETRLPGRRDRNRQDSTRATEAYALPALRNRRHRNASSRCRDQIQREPSGEQAHDLRLHQQSDCPSGIQFPTQDFQCDHLHDS